jgi:hypothetical protein
MFRTRPPKLSPEGTLPVSIDFDKGLTWKRFTGPADLKFENLVLWTRSEIINSVFWFQVSGVRCQKNVPIIGVQNIPGFRRLELTGCSENQWLS